MRIHVFVLAVVVLATLAGPALATPASVQESVTQPGARSVQESCIQENPSMPSSRDAYLGALRRINGSDAFGSFTEFELIRSQSILLVQAGSFETSDRRRTETALRVLWQFRRARACQEAGQYRQALTAANETAAAAAQFESSTGQRLGALVELALTRFYDNVGRALLQRAEQAERTPARIQALSRAAVAFRRAGSTNRFSSVSVRLDRLRREYRTDVQQLNESVAAGTTFLDRCGRCGSPLEALRTYRVRVFPKYETALKRQQAAEQGRQLATKHGLRERANESATIHRRLGANVRTLAIAGSLALVGAAITIALLTALVASRLVTWRQDRANAQLGNIVLMGEMIDD